MKMFVVFVILLHVSQHALAVVVEVNEGERSVQLPCLHSGFIPEEPTVMWTRSDLHPKSVHVRQEGRDDLTGQNQHYSGRTSMRSDALDTSDFSLTLRKPTKTDSGNYTCSISDGRGKWRLRDVQLQVKEAEPFEVRHHFCSDCWWLRQTMYLLDLERRALPHVASGQSNLRVTNKNIRI
ncbi:butyrophilin-like protein 2 [Oreochromis aureus]|uniref:butyrophilin-like protein 2 n=1 Tax=Oreochromis aureus TaxID=47969 RepID=UPI001954C7A9|nr:butyrophilin-like protein 2 [Oreochromis aureus]